MSYASETGYTPASFEALMTLVKDNVNSALGTSYTDETFVGTNLYKYFYGLIQKLQENEVKTSEIYLKVQEYFDVTNQRIARPVVTPPGVIENLESNGYIASVKPPADADAGKAFVCVDKQLDDVDTNWEDSDEYADDKLAVCTIIKDSIVAGVVSQGDQVESITLTNGQSFDFKYALPTRIPVHLKLTITLSENNLELVGDPDETKANLLFNVRSRYAQGKNFEPQKYFNITDDAPWASEILLEWSDDDEDNYYSTVFDADFDEVFDVKLSRIHLVEV